MHFGRGCVVEALDYYLTSLEAKVPRLNCGSNSERGLCIPRIPVQPVHPAAAAAAVRPTAWSTAAATDVPPALRPPPGRSPAAGERRPILQPPLPARRGMVQGAGVGDDGNYAGGDGAGAGGQTGQAAFPPDAAADLERGGKAVPGIAPDADEGEPPPVIADAAATPPGPPGSAPPPVPDPPARRTSLRLAAKLEEQQRAVVSEPDEQPDEQPYSVFCTCHKDVPGATMVECYFQKACKFGRWFHFRCAGLGAGPAGDWPCPWCAAKYAAAVARGGAALLAEEADDDDEESEESEEGGDDDEWDDGGFDGDETRSSAVRGVAATAAGAGRGAAGTGKGAAGAGRGAAGAGKGAAAGRGAAEAVLTAVGAVPAAKPPRVVSTQRSTRPGDEKPIRPTQDAIDASIRRIYQIAPARSGIYVDRSHQIDPAIDVVPGATALPTRSASVWALPFDPLTDVPGRLPQADVLRDVSELLTAAGVPLATAGAITSIALFECVRAAFLNVATRKRFVTVVLAELRTWEPEVFRHISPALEKDPEAAVMVHILGATSDDTGRRIPARLFGEQHATRVSTLGVIVAYLVKRGLARPDEVRALCELHTSHDRTVSLYVALAYFATYAVLYMRGTPESSTDLSLFLRHFVLAPVNEIGERLVDSGGSPMMVELSDHTGPVDTAGRRLPNWFVLKNAPPLRKDGETAKSRVCLANPFMALNRAALEGRACCDPHPKMGADSVSNIIVGVLGIGRPSFEDPAMQTNQAVPQVPAAGPLRMSHLPLYELQVAAALRSLGEGAAALRGWIIAHGHNCPDPVEMKALANSLALDYESVKMFFKNDRRSHGRIDPPAVPAPAVG